MTKDVQADRATRPAHRIRVRMGDFSEDFGDVEFYIDGEGVHIFREREEIAISPVSATFILLVKQPPKKAETFTHRV